MPRRPLASRLILALIAVVALPMSPAPLRAQQIPSVVDPGRIQDELRRERPKLPQAVEPPVIPDFEQARPQDAESIRFELRSIELEGNSAISTDALSAAWRSLIDSEVSLGDLYDVAERVTAEYRRRGYVLSRALVPSQEVEGGRVSLQVVEGYVSEVTIDGDGSLRPMLLNRRAEKIKASRPLHANVLERYLLLTTDLPGISLRAVLRPSRQTPGASELVLQVSEQKVQAFLEANNDGSRFNGPMRAEVGGIFNQVAGVYDQTQIRGISTFDDELQVVALDHTALLNSEGTTLTALGSYVWTNPDGPTVSDLEVDGNSWSFALVARHPILRSRRQNLNGSLSLEALQAKTNVFNTNASSDKLRVLRLGLTYDIVDAVRGVSQVGLIVSQGLDILGATGSNDNNSSRRRGRPNFTKVQASLSRLQGLGRGFTLLAQATGQYAITRVLAPEEASFGGPFAGRAYDSSELTGDHGLTAVLELQWGTALGFTGLESLQLFAFTEYGSIWSRQRGLPRGEHDSAFDVGGGLRANFLDWLSGQVSVAQPITRRPFIAQTDGDRIPRAFFELVARY